MTCDATLAYIPAMAFRPLLHHPPCGPADPWPATFWGPETLNQTAWQEFSGRLRMDGELAAILRALGGHEKSSTSGAAPGS